MELVGVNIEAVDIEAVDIEAVDIEAVDIEAVDIEAVVLLVVAAPLAACAPLLTRPVTSIIIFAFSTIICVLLAFFLSLAR